LRPNTRLRSTSIRYLSRTSHNSPDINGSSVVAFHALQLTGSLMRNLTGYDYTLRGSGPMAWDPTDALVSRAPWDLTLGIVGFGRIGSELGRMAAAALFKLYSTTRISNRSISRLRGSSGCRRLKTAGSVGCSELERPRYRGDARDDWSPATRLLASLVCIFWFCNGSPLHNALSLVLSNAAGPRP